MMTRRDVFVAVLAAGTTSLVLLTPWQGISERLFTPGIEASGLGDGFDEALAALDGTSPVGRAFVDTQSPEPTTETLIQSLRERLGTSLSDRTQAEATIGKAIQADFSAGRTCRVEGWLLSQTECELAGLRWQLLGDAPAIRSRELAAAAAPAPLQECTPGDSASATIANVINWGPQTTEQGTKFNVQPDGHSGMWFQAENVPSWVKVRIDGVEAPTQVSEKGFTSGLFGDTQQRILATPGAYAVELHDPMRNVTQLIGHLNVRPPVERALLADGSRSKVFCPAVTWGPDTTTAGIAANAQPDGSQGMWFTLPCAPRNVQLVFGDDRLPATRTERGVTARVPLALLATPGTIALKLRDVESGEELDVGEFEISPP